MGRPDQARAPAGSPNGGQWVSEDEGGGGQAKEARVSGPSKGPEGRELGNPAAQPREEGIRQKILAVHSKAEQARADARAAVDHANQLIRAANADRSKVPEAVAARDAAKAKNAAANKAEADAAAETHELIKVAAGSGAKVAATASSPLANGGEEAAKAGRFLKDHVAKDAAPSGVHLQILNAGDKIQTGSFAGRTFDGRAHADPIPGMREITARPEVEDHTIVHEFGHVIEAESGAHFKAAVDFLARRTAGMGGPKQLSEMTGIKKYGPKERALDDHFDSKYVGKLYEASGPGSYRGLGATEVTAMGMERMMRDPKGFAQKDPDYFRFTLEQMSRTATPRMELKG